jgi:Animal haem peroxidase
MPSARQFIAVAILFAILIAAALWVADLQAAQMQRWLSTGHLPPIGNPWKGTSAPNFDYYATINAICLSIILLIPAIGAYVLRRGPAPGPLWLLFWTAAWLAFVTHLWYGVGGVLGGWYYVFHDTQTPPRVTNPFGDTLTSIWWTADVALAWNFAFRRAASSKAVVTERSLLHVVILVSALVSSIVLSSNGYVRVAGTLLLFSVFACMLYRIVVYPFEPTSAGGRLYVFLFSTLNRAVIWYKLPTWWAVFNLGALRVVLRAKNLHNTSDIPVSNPAALAETPAFDPADLTARNMDGFWNDLSKPAMGSSSDPQLSDADSMNFTRSNPGARFGRNIPIDQAFPEPEPALMSPSPRLVSTDLLARRHFIPATTLNFLAAAWIQFQTHDWFNHGEPPPDRVFDIPLAANDPWRERSCPMKIRKTRPDPTRDYEREMSENGGRLRYPPTYANAESHWWDASQIYGSNHETTARLRAEYKRGPDGKIAPTGAPVPDGKLYLDEDNLILDPNAINPDDLSVALTGFSGNWWAGLSLLHTLFAREHNAICDELRRFNPDWDGDRIFNTARMVNSALMAKIHTVEWTPAILAHPALEIGMNANWWGLETERLHRAIGRISENEAFAGMPLSGVDHNGADYCLTEEFVSVYRLHPLLRDDLPVRSAVTGKLLATVPMMEGVVGNLDKLAIFRSTEWGFADVFYSFGVANPGAITIHNFPNFLRELTRPDGEVVDLASIDVMRDRERGVPRYNRFLQLLHKKPIERFDDLANPLHPGLVDELRRIYGQTGGRDNVDRVDLMVGLFCEVPPPGFGFSDTAFRIFILMASRRLKSDRFIAKDFTADVYTAEGIDWVNNNSFVSLLLRHFPTLGPALYGVSNGFKPWNDVSSLGRLP